MAWPVVLCGERLQQRLCLAECLDRRVLSRLAVQCDGVPRVDRLRGRLLVGCRAQRPRGTGLRLEAGCNDSATVKPSCHCTPVSGRQNGETTAKQILIKSLLSPFSETSFSPSHPQKNRRTAWGKKSDKLNTIKLSFYLYLIISKLS